MPTHPPAVRESIRGHRAAWIGLLLALILIAAAVAIPLVTGWDVATRASRSEDPNALAPLHGLWQPHLGVATAVAIIVAVLAWRYAPRLSKDLSWRALLAGAFLGSLVWMLSLALVDGPSGISRVLGNPYEYLETARGVTDVGALLQEYISRIPLDAQDNWVTHVAGHPPAMLLFFVGLVRIGLGSDFVAGLVVIVIAASLAPAVLVTLRALDIEVIARRAAPFLVFTPAAVFLAVSADAVIAVVGAWGVAALALASTARSRRVCIIWALVAGLLLGLLVEMSYGMPLFGVLAIAVLVAGKRWLALPIAAAAALAVVLVFSAAGFSLWEAFAVIRERYWDGIARRRPFGYWVWGNLAALAISAGPFVASGLAVMSAKVRKVSVPALLVGAGVLMIVLADLSGMSKAEVERIWLPFIPWLTISLAYLSPRWRSAALAGQLVWALVVQHLFYTVW
ncbi:hypothetical protein FHX49_000045 [Microbacterium endophyticum]|uniref:Integral membrane protein n=1 Tax=Microbacterium endophyticum TaxID=1526412 RepID=A0A7W4V0H9_9MICO|nr:hypothetical protein [Microbacterium endophyticum]MBB2974504.1 hypothetical protein [Microbacterium endophyticum]NIK36801.1 hypothetical protein [Microbacterium endophyticum]